MIVFIVTMHAVACVLLILIVLMQGSKSEGLSGIFGGGGSGTLFGTGTRTFLAKVTTVLGIIFMLTSISLTVLISRRSPSVMENSVMEEKSVMEEESVTEEESVPEGESVMEEESVPAEAPSDLP